MTATVFGVKGGIVVHLVRLPQLLHRTVVITGEHQHRELEERCGVSADLGEIPVAHRTDGFARVAAGLDQNLFDWIDWAEGHHDVALVNAEGERVAKLRIDTGLTGFTELMTLLAEHTDDPAGVSVAIETDKVLIVTALRAAELDVYAIYPRAVARYRER